jgi:hypothetical protein
MSILKRERGRYLLIEDNGTRRYLTNNEVYDLMKKKQLVGTRTGYRGSKQRSCLGGKRIMVNTVENKEKSIIKIGCRYQRDKRGFIRVRSKGASELFKEYLEEQGFERD